MSRSKSAFTLVEVLIALAILSVVVVLLNSVLGGVARAWTAGEQQADQFATGRAALELMARELAQVVISPNLQFVQNPPLPSGINQRTNSDTLFWQVPSARTDSGDLAEVGYYLTETHDASHPGAEAYQLQRFYVPQTSSSFAIFAPSSLPTSSSAPWVSSYVGPSTSSVVATGIVALWVRCFDLNGDLIPWLSSANPGVGGIKYNSAAPFQQASAGATAPGNTNPGVSFTYTPASIAPAHALPATVELTLTTVDSRTLSRNPSIPGQVAQTAPDTLPSARAQFEQSLVSNRINTFRTFSTRVRLRATPQ